MIQNVIRFTLFRKKKTNEQISELTKTNNIITGNFFIVRN